MPVRVTLFELAPAAREKPTTEDGKRFRTVVMHTIIADTSAKVDGKG